VLPLLAVQNNIWGRDEKRASWVWKSSLATASLETTMHGFVPTMYKLQSEILRGIYGLVDFERYDA
jgi:hypothetical protein